MAGLSLRPPKIEVRETGTGRGIGVYAVEPLKSGDHVETCPVIVFFADDHDALPKLLKERTFDWSALIAKPAGQHALALGYGSIYNHDNPANLSYSAMRSNMTLTFTAVRLIEAGEELTINYDERSGFNANAESAWMKRHGVDPA